MFVAGIGLTSNVRTRLEAVNVTEDGLAERISSYLLHSRADKTNDKYRASFKKFQQFCAQKNYQSVPVDPISFQTYWIKIVHLVLYLQCSTL